MFSDGCIRKASGYSVLCLYSTMRLFVPQEQLRAIRLAGQSSRPAQGKAQAGCAVVLKDGSSHDRIKKYQWQNCREKKTDTEEKEMFWRKKNSQEETLAKLEEFLCESRETMEENRSTDPGDRSLRGSCGL